MSKKIDCFSFFTGITYPFRTVNLVIKKPYLWQYLIIPIIVNFIVGIILYVSFFFPSWKLIQNLILKFSLWLEQLINDLPSWLHFLTYLLLAISGVIKFVFVLALFILIGFVIVQFGCILGAPWYGKLSEELEKIKTGEVADSIPACFSTRSASIRKHFLRRSVLTLMFYSINVLNLSICLIRNSTPIQCSTKNGTTKPRR